MIGGFMTRLRISLGGAAPAFVLLMGFSGGAALAVESSEEMIAYGAYLSGECATCHLSGKQLDSGGSAGHFSGVPGIVGLDSAHFIDAMMAYRSGERTNPAMVSAARALDDEQIAALAAYYASIAERQ